MARTADAIRAARPSGSRSSTSACTTTSRRTSTASSRSSTVWAERVRDGIDQQAFVDAARADAGDDADLYDRVAPFWQSWQGMKRYWDKRNAA